VFLQQKKLKNVSKGGHRRAFGARAGLRCNRDAVGATCANASGQAFERVLFPFADQLLLTLVALTAQLALRGQRDLIRHRLQSHLAGRKILHASVVFNFTNVS